ncbi:hypothetical protein FB451DRAFT_208522 [Mycena latifolia]|nr:hypothetical protein FB451DRAFT_208522 [Mycena latifolia]
MTSGSMLSTSRVSQHKDINAGPPPLPYAPQSYRSDIDSAMLSPQSILTTSSGAPRVTPPQSYFDPGLSMVPVQIVQHQPLSMHTQDSSVLARPMSAVSHAQSGYGVHRHPVHMESMISTAASHLQPESENQHNSVSVSSQDSAMMSWPSSQVLDGQHPTLPITYLHPGQQSISQQYQDISTSPQHTITAPGYSDQPPQSLAQGSIEEVPRHPEQPQIVFQFGAPTQVPPGGPTFPDAQVLFVEPRYEP